MDFEICNFVDRFMPKHTHYTLTKIQKVKKHNRTPLSKFHRFILFYFILFYFILFYFILFYLFYFILFYFILLYFMKILNQWVSMGCSGPLFWTIDSKHWDIFEDISFCVPERNKMYSNNMRVSKWFLEGWTTCLKSQTAKRNTNVFWLRVSSLW